MRAGVRELLIAAMAAAGGAMIAVTALPVEGQQAAPPAAYRAPRLPDGKPDLNGIWQALNEANYDLEPHMARSALALRPGISPWISIWVGALVAGLLGLGLNLLP